MYSAALEVQSGTANNKQFSRRWAGPPPLKQEQRPRDRTAHSGNRLGYGAVLIPPSAPENFRSYAPWLASIDFVGSP